MQFRERRRVIQIIRTVYDPELKRGKSVVIGKIDKFNPEISSELKETCSEAEIKEITTWLDQHLANKKHENIRADTFDLPRQMRQAADYFEHFQEEDDEVAELAAEIYDSWTILKKSLRKAGLTKSKIAPD